MLDLNQYKRIAHLLPVLQGAEPELVNEFQKVATLVALPAGRDVFVEGDRVDGIALLISGIVRVYKVGETGREITLYRFGLGESCILTTNAILNDKSFPAIATVEQDAEAVMIPTKTFRDWVRRYDTWHNFVFDLLSRRLSTMMAVVEEVAFQRTDLRLASWLLNQAKVENPIRVTHQHIAAELGSSREVVSRLLADLSAQGLIQSKRGEIEVIDLSALTSRSAM